MTTSENIRSKISQLVQPLRDQLDELNQEIDVAVQNLAALRQTKHGLTKVLRQIDPTFALAKAKVTTAKSSNGYKVSAKTLADVREWLYQHSNQLSKESFSGTSLRKTHGFRLYSQSITLIALRVLHDEGFLRLDHSGRAGQKFYKVVS